VSDLSVEPPVRLSLEFPEELVDALVERIRQQLDTERRWHTIESLAEYLNLSVRQVRGLRERGMPAKRIGKRLVFDRLEVDRWLELR
jgi:excisionase family DNA binding protein